MTKVWLAYSCSDNYDGGDTVIGVFAEKDLADAFVEKCKRADARAPQAPEKIEDTPENDKLYDEWYAKLQRWEARHPAKGNNRPSLGYRVAGWSVRRWR